MNPPPSERGISLVSLRVNLGPQQFDRRYVQQYWLMLRYV